MKNKVPVVGGICQSTQGRDKDRYYVICSVQNDGLVLVVDGNFKKLAEPKKKNVKHLRLLPDRAEAIGAKLLDGRQVFDSEVYSALKNLNYPKPDGADTQTQK